MPYRRPKGPATSKGRPITSQVRGWWVGWWYRKYRGLSEAVFIKKKGEMSFPFDQFHRMVLAMAKRPTSVQGTGGFDVPDPDYGSWGRLYPNLVGILCDARWDDGSEKGPTQIAIKRDGSCIKITLKLADGQLCMRVSAVAPDAALLALEAALKSDSPPWEKDPYPLESGRRPKGKRG